MMMCSVELGLFYYLKSFSSLQFGLILTKKKNTDHKGSNMCFRFLIKLSFSVARNIMVFISLWYNENPPYHLDPPTDL